MDLEALVRAAAGGDLDAFAAITRRFQHMAFGYALSFVRDLGQAEDIVQEAFVAAWYGLPSLGDPAAFAGWLRSIVRHRAHRVLRTIQTFYFRSEEGADFGPLGGSGGCRRGDSPVRRSGANRELSDGRSAQLTLAPPRAPGPRTSPHARP